MEKFILGILLLFFSIVTLGHASYYDNRFRYNNGFFFYVGSSPNYYSQTKCKYIPAHFYRGIWYPAKQVCYQKSYRNNIRCGWVPGHWRDGIWYPKHQVCWR